MIKAQPFLKWAGGKRQLINEIEKNLPKQISRSKVIDIYIEPFVGGGALLFHLLSNYTVNKCIINDINRDLILTYTVVKQYPDELIKKLRIIENEFISLPEEEKPLYFYNNLRLPFNELKVSDISIDKKNNIQKVALLIALNKTCFNGLYRQNSKGGFNVPFGRYKNPKILNEENIINCSKLLQNTEILCGGYEEIEIPKETKAFIYFDPPYRPLSKTSGFTKYSKEDFNDDDQKKLASYYNRLSKQGHFLLLSNSDPKNQDINDNFFDDLYKDFNIQRVSAKRFINADSSKRGSVNELMIKSY